MQYIYQFLIILAFSFLGEQLSKWIPLPIPASVYGLVLLFAALQLRIVKLKHVEQGGSFLQSLLPLLFVAPAVNLLSCWDLIAPHLLSIAAIVIGSTAVVFLVSGKLTQSLLGRKGRKGNG